MAGIEAMFDAAPRSVPLARRWLTDVAGADPGYDMDVARLLLSELATNAVLHARTAMVIRAIDDGWRLRVEVTDSGVGMEQPEPRVPGADAESGRGLDIVDLLAADWGVRPNGPHAPGVTVWFELSSLTGPTEISLDGVGA
jgi:anti-sigma regulatory factor (Ser/Thr protein kinase)